MATAIIGITGNVTMPTGFNIYVKRGDFQLTVKEIETTNTTTSAGNAEYLGGLRMGKGSAVGIPETVNAPGWATLSTGNVAQIPAACTFNVVGTTCKYTFNALITNIRLGFIYAGESALTFDFVVSGPITEVWA